MFFEKYLELNVKFEAKDEYGRTLLHWAASDGSFLTEWSNPRLGRNLRVHCPYCSSISDKMKYWLDSALNPLKVFSRWSSKIFSRYIGPSLNAQTNLRWVSPFYPLDCYDFSEFVDLILQNATKLNIDLNAKNNDGQTAFHLAWILGKTENIRVFTNNAPTTTV